MYKRCLPYSTQETERGCPCKAVAQPLSFALLGLHVTFIISTVSTGVPVLCGVVSALMHYFFLAAEAIHLHKKLVIALKPDIKSYLTIAMAIYWGMSVCLGTCGAHVCMPACMCE